jgi:hypothetical protein
LKRNYIWGYANKKGLNTTEVDDSNPRDGERRENPVPNVSNIFQISY